MDAAKSKCIPFIQAADRRFAMSAALPKAPGGIIQPSGAPSRDLPSKPFSERGLSLQ
jgi:hypothetical protein